MKSLACLFAVAVLLSVTAAAQTPLASIHRDAAIAEIREIITDHYYDPARGQEIARELDAHVASGAIDDARTAEQLAERLEVFLRDRDRHFQVDWHGPDQTAAILAQSQAAETDDEAVPNPAEWDWLIPDNYGFAAVEVLPHNIGYLRLTSFAPLIVSRAGADAALTFLDRADAVVIDLRGNQGGEPELVRYLLSHFMPAGQSVHYNTILPRNGEPTEFRTLGDHPMGHRPGVPLFVLVGSSTFSAGEALAYHLQALGRASLIGETTAGAGNPGTRAFASSGFSVFVSDTTSRSPITGTNWDGVGVIPDLAAPSDAALDRAVEAILDLRRHQEPDSDAAVAASWELAQRSADQGWIPVEADHAAVVGQYGPARVWVERGQLHYRNGEGEVLNLNPLSPGVHVFAHRQDVQVTFPGAETGRATALRQAYPSGDHFDRPRTD